tara:strand:+ start:177 stop:1274 length:1098 start_codon:yes stop_codon:yes gene_type:complete
MSTEIPKFTAEYVWIGGNHELRSKTKMIPRVVDDALELPSWNYDGSSTAQAPGHNSEVRIIPRAIFKDPFRPKDTGLLVMCDTFVGCGNDMKPHKTNSRLDAAHFFASEKSLEMKPWFGMEQEYYLMDIRTRLPMGVPQYAVTNNKNENGINIEKQGKYYCGVGAGKALGRTVAEHHLRLCVEAGIRISGINAEVGPAQWEFQVGPCEGIEMGDHLWMARYILQRVAENYGVIPTLDPKPLSGDDWNGSGCHTNFSTEKMRICPAEDDDTDEFGLNAIKQAAVKLGEKHKEHMRVYGDGNDKRMTGTCETSSMTKFTWGIADRGASVRIGREIEHDKCGYLEDRRPSANSDPYVVSYHIAKTVYG